MIGKEYARVQTFSPSVRAYIRLFGIPILGLRVRAQRMRPLIRQYAKPGLILDVGSGRGIFSFEMARMFPGSRVIGYDLDEEHIRTTQNLATDLGLKNLRFEKQDIFESRLDGQVTTLLNIDTLEHIEDDKRFLQRFFELLAPGGLLLLHVPHYYRNIFGFKRVNFDVHGHFRPGYRLRDLREMVENTGLSIRQAGYTYSSLETLANDLSYLITEAREKRKGLYSITFPWLLILAKAGQFSKPRFGSGVFVVAKRPSL